MSQLNLQAQLKTAQADTRPKFCQRACKANAQPTDKQDARLTPNRITAPTRNWRFSG